MVKPKTQDILTTKLYRLHINTV